MKKIALLLAFALILSVFTACGNTKSPAGESETPVNSEVLNTDDDIIVIPPVDSSGEGDSGDTVASKSEYAPPDVDIDITANGLLILGDRCMEAFGGSYDTANLYAQYVTKYKADLGGSL